MKNKNINRIGRFRISLVLIEKAEYDNLVSVMKNFIVIRCEAMFASRELEYTAISHLFEEKEPNAIAPEYNIEISYGKKNKVISVEAKIKSM